MDGLIFVTLVFFYLFLIMGLISFYRYLEQRRELKQHVHEIAELETSLKNVATRKEKVLSKVFKFSDDLSALGHRINFFSETIDVEKWLMLSGYPLGLSVDRFQGLKIFSLLFGAVVGIFLFVLGFPFGSLLLITLPVLGYFSVIYWLRSKVKKRQEDLSRNLPDFMDTVSVTLQAGVGLDNALRQISPYFKGPIQEEFNRFNQKISLGVPREQAYNELLERNDSYEFQKLIKGLIQGAQLGVPVSKTFKIQSEEMRKIKKEQIKEQASKASPKVTLITTFVVLPTAMILIGGLMVLNLLFGDHGVFDVLL
ncbi:type II secretion system F family protein [Salicibibacter cibi]|uniref:Type II secretion system F family protein n=1 Tax=Salicibibacter cibi TaxID=2743001 RepID=A0A7T6ZDA8_9BACI|nr:type II secretion system F family protein [Salicibibacter cibi]QQK81403.1 type II secretion system F family protein [Salicibibacter cibi]